MELERSLNGNPDIVHPKIYDVSRAFDKIALRDSLGLEELELTETHLRLCRTPQPDRPNRPVPR